MEVVCLSSFEKVFYSGPTSREETTEGTALLGEKYAIQFAFQGAEEFTYDLRLSQEIDLAVFEVKQVPSQTPIKEIYDAHILTGVPGYFPDVLQPVERQGRLSGTAFQWHSLWVELSSDVPLEESAVTVSLTVTAEEQTMTSRFNFGLIPIELPAQTLIHTEWLHTDCLASHYEVEIFSEDYWQLVEDYIAFGVAHGQNMVLTPLFTPPLDMEVGSQRPTVQLVDIEVKEGCYDFDFQLLDRWSAICRKVGIEYLELSHLYTQWGAEAAPKILGRQEGELVQLFGWETSSTGAEYQGFLAQFVPALVNWLVANNWQESAFFHLSDEPSADHLERYRIISDQLKAQLAGIPIIDALSNYGFYQEGLVDIPVVANDHIQPFIDHQVQPLWTYYCNAQKLAVSNRFFDMPSARNRIIGYQLFQSNVTGFLHWGYNFWYSQYSRHLINPFEVTDAEGAFPSGDAFLVYPGEKGPLASLRLKVLHYGLQDQRALNKLAALTSVENVQRWLKAEGGQLTFSDYPTEACWQLAIREKLNACIKLCVEGSEEVV